MAIILTLAALALYLASTSLLVVRMRRGILAAEYSKVVPLAIGLLGALLHAVLLAQTLFQPSGLDLALFHVVSLTGWLVALLVLAAAFSSPVENLGVVVLPLAALALLAQWLPERTPVLVAGASAGLKAHILLSIVSYSLLALAAVQALLLAVQDRHLRNRQPGGFIRALPPLETMERLLFRLIGIGYIILSLSLITGAHFIYNIFAQHLVHKTVLSIAAWALFAVLLWGRWRFGWRGRTAIRWTLGGFAVLVLAYFGSKLVLEVILGQPTVVGG